MEKAAREIIETLQDALIIALPYVEEAAKDKIYKPGVASGVLRKMRTAIDMAELELKW